MFLQQKLNTKIYLLTPFTSTPVPSFNLFPVWCGCFGPSKVPPYTHTHAFKSRQELLLLTWNTSKLHLCPAWHSWKCSKWLWGPRSLPERLERAPMRVNLSGNFPGQFTSMGNATGQNVSLMASFLGLPENVLSSLGCPGKAGAGLEKQGTACTCPPRWLGATRMTWQSSQSLNICRKR